MASIVRKLTTLNPPIWLSRTIFNFFPSYFGSGGKIVHIAKDWSKITVRIKCNWRTVNINGVVFGGSIYSCVDPLYVMQLLKILGPDYVVWDKSASIKFLRPVHNHAFASTIITPEIVADIKRNIAQNNKYTFILPIVFTDESGVVEYARLEKELYVADAEYFKNRAKRSS